MEDIKVQSDLVPPTDPPDKVVVQGDPEEPHHNVIRLIKERRSQAGGCNGLSDSSLRMDMNS